jgi:putative thioredoxin
MTDGTTTVTKIDVTDADFAQTVLEASKERPVVVDLWAEWCGPCRTLGPILEKVAEERKGAFLLAKLDVDANPGVANALRVQSIPFVVAFRDGKPVDGFVGAIPEPQVNAFVDRLFPTAGDVAADAAAADADAGDLDGAEAKYRAILADEPKNHAAAVGLAILLVERGAADEATALLTPLLPDAEAEAVLARITVESWGALAGGSPADVARRKAAEGDFRGALDGLLAALPDDPEARASILELFRLLGEGELVAEYRRKLTNALY